MDIQYFDELPSTNDYAKENDLPNGTVVQAGFQSAGRGRLGRQWQSGAGDNLLFSVVYYLEEKLPPGSSGNSFPVAAIPFIPLLTGAVICRHLQKWLEERSFSADALSLKWPNDLIWEHAKLGGILVEAEAIEKDGVPVQKVVVGIGLNMHSAPDLSTDAGEARLKPISLAQALAGQSGSTDAPEKQKEIFGTADERQQSMRTFLEGLVSDLHSLFLNADPSKKQQVEGWLSYLSQRFYLKGRRIISDEGLEGICLGFSLESGALLVQAGENVEELVAGDFKIV